MPRHPAAPPILSLTIQGLLPFYAGTFSVIRKIEREVANEVQPPQRARRCPGGASRRRRVSPGFGGGGPDLEDFPSVSRRDDRRGRLPRPPVPQVRGRAREAHRRGDRRAGLSELVADEDGCPVLRAAQR